MSVLNVLLLACVIACPIVMGAMMLMMRRHEGGHETKKRADG